MLARIRAWENRNSLCPPRLVQVPAWRCIINTVGGHQSAQIWDDAYFSLCRFATGGLAWLTPLPSRYVLESCKSVSLTHLLPWLEAAVLASVSTCWPNSVCIMYIQSSSFVLRSSPASMQIGVFSEFISNIIFVGLEGVITGCHCTACS